MCPQTRYIYFWNRIRTQEMLLRFYELTVVRADIPALILASVLFDGFL